MDTVRRAPSEAGHATDSDCSDTAAFPITSTRSLFSSSSLGCFPRELLMAAPSLVAGRSLRGHLSLERPFLTLPILMAPTSDLSPFPCPVLFVFITQPEMIAVYLWSVSPT